MSGSIENFILVEIIVTFVKVCAISIGDAGEAVNLEVYSALVQLLKLFENEPAVGGLFHK